MGFFDWIFKRKKNDLHLDWNDSYRMDIFEVDIQHKKLFDLYNDMVTAIYNGESAKTLQKSLDDLLEYVIVHFTTEEGYMEKYGYPGYEVHKTEHKMLREKTYYIHKDFSEGKPVLTMEVLVFLKDWISHHILTVDRQYRGFLKNKVPKELQNLR